MTAYPFTFHTAIQSGAARVTLAGELDLATGPHVERAVAACLAENPASVCLDLTGVTFCDCSGLNALLSARMSVLDVGAALIVEGIGPQLARLLFLAGADGLFPADDPSDATGTTALGAPGVVVPRRETAGVAAPPLGTF